MIKEGILGITMGAIEELPPDERARVQRETLLNENEYTAKAKAMIADLLAKHNGDARLAANNAMSMVGGLIWEIPKIEGVEAMQVGVFILGLKECLELMIPKLAMDVVREANANKEKANDPGTGT